jgi:hypothetical protein
MATELFPNEPIGCITNNLVRYSERKNKHETPKPISAAPLNTAFSLDGNTPLGEYYFNRDRVCADYIGGNIESQQCEREYPGRSSTAACGTNQSNYLSHGA